jgi:metal-responsive CopG/Arc/MetJ family transcriptional regulator
MARTIIDIPDAQLHEVDSLCKLLGISRAEAVRRALHDFVERNDDVNTDGFGLWKGIAADRNALLAKMRRLE